MDICTTLIILASGILLYLLAPFVARPLAGTRSDDLRFPRYFCHRLCDLKVALAILLGLALGFFVCTCWPELQRLIGRNGYCLIVLFYALLAALIVAFFYVRRVLECGGRSDARSGVSPLVIYRILLVLALLILLILVWHCGASFDGRLQECAQLLVAIIFIGWLFLLVRGLELRWCNPDTDTDVAGCVRALGRLGNLLLALLLIVLGALIYCWDHLQRDEFDLAMVGIHWNGKYDGEFGAHLRWGFRDQLPFPENGFDLFRRESSSGAWTKLDSLVRTSVCAGV